MSDRPASMNWLEEDGRWAFLAVGGVIAGAVRRAGGTFEPVMRLPGLTIARGPFEERRQAQTVVEDATRLWFAAAGFKLREAGE